MLNYRFDITSALTRHHPPTHPHPPAAGSVCSSLPPFSSSDEPLLPENGSALLLLPDQVVSFIGLLVFPRCCVVRFFFFFSSFLWRFLDSFPGLRDGLQGCLQINSRGEIGTFRKQRSVSGAATLPCLMIKTVVFAGWRHINSVRALIVFG